MALRPLSPPSYVADTTARKIIARFADDEGRVYEVDFPEPRIVAPEPPTAEADLQPEPTTGRKDRHRLPGAYRPAAPAFPGGPVIPDRPLVLAPEGDVDHHQEL